VEHVADGRSGDVVVLGAETQRRAVGGGGVAARERREMWVVGGRAYR